MVRYNMFKNLLQGHVQKGQQLLVIQFEKLDCLQISFKAITELCSLDTPS